MNWASSVHFLHILNTYCIVNFNELVVSHSAHANSIRSAETRAIMMTSSNGNIFRVTGPFCGEFTGPGEFPTQRPVARSFDVYFDLRLNKRLCKQSWGWWFETLLCPLWRHSNDVMPTTNAQLRLEMWTTYYCKMVSYNAAVYERCFHKNRVKSIISQQTFVWMKVSVKHLKQHRLIFQLNRPNLHLSTAH